jgi:hypothetical protein
MIDHSRRKLRLIDWGLAEFYHPRKTNDNLQFLYQNDHWNNTKTPTHPPQPQNIYSRCPHSTPRNVKSLSPLTDLTIESPE